MHNKLKKLKQIHENVLKNSFNQQLKKKKLKS